METFVRYIVLYCIILLNFIISGLVVNMVQIILYCTVRPFSKYFFRKINYYVSYTLYSHIVFVVQWSSNSDIFIYIDEKDLEYFGKEHACVIVNHRYEIDWLLFCTISNKFYTLGNIKAFAKKSIQYMPTLGWCLYLSDNIFLMRSSFKEDKTVIQKQLLQIFQSSDPLWILLFPEGTRYNTSKHKKSMALARKKDLPLLKHHLLPKPRGFLTSLPKFRNNVGALYDMTITVIPTNEVKPSLLNLLLGKRLTSHVYIKRIPLEEVPQDEKEATEFLNDMFIRKDKLLDSFLNTGDYFLESGITRIEPFKLAKTYKTLVIISIFFIVTIIPLWYCIVQYLYAATINNILPIICGFCLGMYL